MRVIVSVTDREAGVVADLARGDTALARFADALVAAELSVYYREATAQDVDGSSWAKRLGIPRRRPAWVLQGAKR